MFKEHITAGAILSMAVVVAVYFYALITDPLLLAVLFLVTIIGSFLPDVDSDSGVPFFLVFGFAVLCVAGAVLYYVLQRQPDEIYILVGAPIAAIFFMWFVIGTIIKRFTRHRGIFHSIPAMLVAGLLTYLLARHLGADILVSKLLGAGMIIGFASHLILDEVHSEVNMDGNPFVHKRSLGTAMKLFSGSRGVNLAAYTILAALVYTALH